MHRSGGLPVNKALRLLLSACLTVALCLPALAEAAFPSVEAGDAEAVSQAVEPWVAPAAALDADTGLTLWDEPREDEPQVMAEPLPEVWSAEDAAEEPVTPAEEAEGELPIDLTQPGTELCFAPGEAVAGLEFPTDGDLFAGYAGRLFYGDGDIPLASTRAGAQLTGADRALYDELKAHILAVAEGQEISTRFEVPFSYMLPKLSFTSEELGVELQYDARGGILYESWDALSAAFEARAIPDYSRVLDALTYDCPYELYWYDHYFVGSSITWSGYSVRFDGEQGSYVCGFDADNPTMVVTMEVLDEYAGADHNSVDTSRIQSARQAAQNARDIVAKYAANSDYAKLFGYATEICALVDYNYPAAEDYWDIREQNPWMLIWVFDGDPETSVVCEGYARAFQYLCDITRFDGDIRSYEVDGDADGGAHAWNVVRMDDGGSYLVDVTWMDDDVFDGLDGTMADWASTQRFGLFLAGAESGSVSEGYAVRYADNIDGSWSGGVTLREYSPETLNAYPASALALAGERYVPSGFQRMGGGTYYFRDDGSYVTGVLSLGGMNYRFGDDGKLISGWAGGWREVDGKRYYFDETGLHTQHTELVEPAVSPTCTEPGMTEGVRCAVCGLVLAQREVVPAKGHKPVYDSAVSPTCTEIGWTKGSHCGVCGEVLTPRQPVAAKGHTAVVEAAVAPGCTTSGWTQGSHCSVCGAMLAVRQSLPATGHTPVPDPAVAPTATATGLTEGSHCAVCGEVLTAQQIVPERTLHMAKSASHRVEVGEEFRIVVDSSAVKGYKSSNRKVAGVTGDGVVTALKAGSAKITVALKGKKKLTLKLKVSDPYAPTKVSVAEGKKLTLRVGETLQLNAVLAPDAARSALTWKSSRKGVARVSADGLVTARKKGTATVTVRTQNGKTAKVKIKVIR